MTPSRILPVLLLLVLAVLQGAPAATAAAPPPQAQTGLALPEPTGRLEVSTRVRQLTDTSRPDPWRDGPRRLVTTLTYPTRHADGRPAPYVTAAESAAYLAFQAEQGSPVPDSVPRDVLAHVETRASVGDRPLRVRGGLPLVVLSPGFSLPRATLTGLATDLASRGFAVVSVDHVGESTGTTLAGGELVGCVACDTEDYAAVARSRAADLSFAIDRYARDPLVDARRVAVVGHSIGGNAAATVMRSDRRVDAGANLDGTFFDAVARPLDRPFLMMGTDELHRPDGEDESWPAAWSRLVGFSRWLTVSGSAHFSFTDLPLLVEQAGLPSPIDLGGRRGTDLTRAYVGAFLERSLRLAPGRLLDGPGRSYLEVSFHEPR